MTARAYKLFAAGPMLSESKPSCGRPRLPQNLRVPHWLHTTAPMVNRSLARQTIRMGAGFIPLLRQQVKPHSLRVCLCGYACVLAACGYACVQAGAGNGASRTCQVECAQRAVRVERGR
jgi:hypothetical protein